MAELIHIARADDPRLAAFRLNERGLSNRADKRDDAGAGLFLAEGDLVVERALAAGCVPVAGLSDAERPSELIHAVTAAGADVFLGGDDVRRMVTGLGMPQPIVALFRRPPRPPASELLARCRRIVVVEGVDNPANVGAIVRNAAAFGWDGLLLDHTSADPLARRSLRVAMGTAFRVPFARTRTLTHDLQSAAGGLQLLALTPEPTAIDVAAAGAADRRAILIGSERVGLSDALLALATRVRIPMAEGVDSLNAAAAAAVACYALA